MGATSIVSSVRVKDPAISRALDQLEVYINKTAPFGKFEYVDVTFNATANVDTDIVHTLMPINPETVQYQVLRIDRAASIYHDTSASRKPWRQNLIYLRSSAANAVATLLLTLPVA